MKSISVPSSAQATRLQKAANVTAEIVKYAKLIYTDEFKNEPHDIMLPAIIQAMAISYAAAAVDDGK